MSETDNIALGNHVVPTEWAQQLERERDEAREERENIQTELEMWRDGNIMHEIHRNELERVEQERDEAREALTSQELVIAQHNVITDLMIERNEAREKIERQTERIRYLEGATNHAEGTPLSIALKERDEARAVADELSSIAARYLGWHLSRTPMGPDDDHLAQASRITETLARWKALASA